MKCDMRWFLIIVLITSAFSTSGQVSNDNCLAAIDLGSISDFCSQDFTNVGASASTEERLGCWAEDDTQSDVWYTFRIEQQGLLLSFFGSGSRRDETLDRSAYGLYTGRCSSLSEVDCIRRDNGEDDVYFL